MFRKLRWLCVVFVPALVLAGVTGSAAAGEAAGEPAGGTGGGAPAGGSSGVAEGTFEVVEFTIEPYQVLPNGVTLNRFHADDVFHGDLQGTGTAEAQMLSRPDGTTNEAGFIHVEGELGGRSGGFVIQTIGRSTVDTAEAMWTILPGSGTGDLTGISGRGRETAANDGSGWVATYRLTYQFP